MKIRICFLILGFVFVTAEWQPANAQTLTVLHSFRNNLDGAYPYGGLVRDAAGNLYGTTYGGGDHTCNRKTGCGTVFEVSSIGKEKVLYEFTGLGGEVYSYGDLFRDSDGTLYGTTAYGGDFEHGSVFKLDKTGNATTLYSFAGSPDGRSPLAGVIRDRKGNLYGTTNNGGDPICDCGVVFKISASGEERVLHTFTGLDGDRPRAALIRDSDGNLYGTTTGGGDGNAGTIFEIDKSGNETILHSFLAADGVSPHGPVIRDDAGTFYGTTEIDGAVPCTAHYFGACGTVFRLDAGGNFTVLYQFTGFADGGLPQAGLVLDAGGNLYGTTYFGGDLTCDRYGYGCGVVFRVDANGNETVLHTFVAGTDGALPAANLITDPGGNLYGTTVGGGPNNAGTVFKLTLQ